MAEKPILFSGPMVRAIMSGRKNVTRRLMNPQPPVDAETCHHNSYSGPDGPAWWWFKGTSNGEQLQCWPEPGKVVESRHRKGDICYVKEAWRADNVYDDEPPREIPKYADIEYLATDVPYFIGRYRNARFMCRWMSRLWLRVTEDPYPERVRDITEAEAKREGVQLPPVMHADTPQWVWSYVEHFKLRWAEIYGPDSWERDWVWRYAFERMEAPDA